MMALFVVLIHVKPNVHLEILTTVFNLILSRCNKFDHC